MSETVLSIGIDVEQTLYVGPLPGGPNTEEYVYFGRVDGSEYLILARIPSKEAATLLRAALKTAVQN